MKKFELSEEFILRAHSAACKDWKKEIEKEVPELFEVGLEVGKWYDVSLKSDKTPYGLLHFTKIEGSRVEFYGIRHYYGNNWVEDWLSTKACIIKPATEEEVKTALVKEAEKRGYKKGIVIKYNGYEGKIIDDIYWAIGDKGIGVLTDSKTRSNQSFPLMIDGKWTEIIQQPPTKYTIAQLEEKLNEKIEIVG